MAPTSWRYVRYLIPPCYIQDSTSTVEVNAEATIKLDQHVTADLVD